MKRDCPAAVHVDSTARPQLVSAEGSPSFHRLLTEYYKLTGIPSVINTSFNMHEEPIVCSPDDAIRAFLVSSVAVFIGNGLEFYDFLTFSFFAVYIAVGVPWLRFLNM